MKSTTLKKIPIFATLTGAAAVTWWVLWFMITGSLMSLEEINASLGPALTGAGGSSVWPLLPSWPTLAPLAELLLDTPEYFSMFWNTMRLVLPSVLGQLVIGAPAAYALSRFSFKGRKFLTAVYIALMLMPFQVTMVPNYLVNEKIGIMDTLWAVILPFIFSAFPVFIMKQSFDSVPKALLEAAAIDGAGPVRAFFSVGLPLGMPGVISASVLGFLECFSAIEQPIIFLKSPVNWPLSLYLPQITAEKLGLAMAASLMMLAPAILVFLFGQKYLELGIQSSGIKE